MIRAGCSARIGMIAAAGGAAPAVPLGPNGPGALVVSTHRVNVIALAGIVPASGEGVVLRRERDALVWVSRIRLQPRAERVTSGADRRVRFEADSRCVRGSGLPAASSWSPAPASAP
jgi:hypothetical protein